MDFTLNGISYHVDSTVTADRTHVHVTHGGGAYTVYEADISHLSEWLRTRLSFVRYLKRELSMLGL